MDELKRLKTPTKKDKKQLVQKIIFFPYVSMIKGKRKQEMKEPIRK